MLETVSISLDSWQIQNGAIVDAPNCGCPATLEKVTDFSKDSSWLNLANIVFTTSEICASDTTLTL